MEIGNESTDLYRGNQGNNEASGTALPASISRSYTRRSSWSNLVRSMQDRNLQNSKNYITSSQSLSSMNSEVSSVDNNNDDEYDTKSIRTSTNKDTNEQQDHRVGKSSTSTFDNKLNSTLHMANNFRRKIILSRRRIIIPIGNNPGSNLNSNKLNNESVALSVTGASSSIPPVNRSYATTTKLDEEVQEAVRVVPATDLSANQDSMSILSSNYHYNSKQNDVNPTLATTINGDRTTSVPSTETSLIDSLHQSDVFVIAKEKSKGSSNNKNKTKKLQDDIVRWVQALNELKDSDEMSSFIQSTIVVTSTAASLMAHIALYPVVLPYRVCTSASNLVWNSSMQVMQQSKAIMAKAITKSSTGCSTGESSSSYPEHPVMMILQTAVDLPVIICWTIPITAVNIASDITGTVISNALTIVGLNKPDYNPHYCADLLLQEAATDPASESKQDATGSDVSTAGQPSSEQIGQHYHAQQQHQLTSLDFLDRLRLDLMPPVEQECCKQIPPQANNEVKRIDLPVVYKPDSVTDRPYDNKVVSSNTPEEPSTENEKKMFEPIKVQMNSIVEKSLYLLRVNDIELIDENEEAVSYLDVSGDSTRDRTLLKQALDRLIVRGLSMLANHPPARLNCKTYSTTPRTEIKWHPINQTKNILGRMAQMSNSLDRIHVLEKETLIWTGDYVVQKGYEGFGRNFSLYLARGIVGLSPSDFMRLLWNDQRTMEYNQYSNGRTTETSIENEDILLSDVTTTSTKTIRSETRVPLTKFTIETRCLMHVRALDAPDDGYVILSRSLDHGDAGTHYNGSMSNKKSSTKAKTVEKCDNQILWGINILKCVPNHPHLTDLISLSHVSTPNVPGFFGRRIAMMGIEDFFTNIRKVAATEANNTPEKH